LKNDYDRKLFLRPGELVVAAIRKHLPNDTVDDYQHWEGDWELWEGDWELCDGIPISTRPGPFGIHQRIASRLLVAMQNQLADQGCRGEVIHVQVCGDCITELKPREIFKR
jgi:Uma2 family endonuclease